MTLLNFDQLGVPAEIEEELTRLSATYEIRKLADKGSNGYLFIARNRLLGRDVAIKFYFWVYGAAPHFEPGALAAVQSDAIIEVLDASVVGGEWARFITPFCANGDLDRYRESHRFGLRSAIRFIEKLLNGVSSLHQMRFVHRDLKPENILVSDSGGPLIADFGSVRLIPEAQDYAVGSGHAALYRPPESATHSRYDRRGDIYQVGMVLFQVLGGRLAYDGAAFLSEEERCNYRDSTDSLLRTQIVDAAIARRAAGGTLLDLTTLPFFVNNRVRRIVRKATDPDPAKRYQHASDMMSELHAACAAAVDWTYESGTPVAVNGSERLRVVKVGQRTFRVEHTRDKKWRRVPNAADGSLATQLKIIARRCSQ